MPWLTYNWLQLEDRYTAELDKKLLNIVPVLSQHLMFPGNLLRDKNPKTPSRLYFRSTSTLFLSHSAMKSSQEKKNTKHNAMSITKNIWSIITKLPDINETRKDVAWIAVIQGFQ